MPGPALPRAAVTLRQDLRLVFELADRLGVELAAVRAADDLLERRAGDPQRRRRAP